MDYFENRSPPTASPTQNSIEAEFIRLMSESERNRFERHSPSQRRNGFARYSNGQSPDKHLLIQVTPSKPAKLVPLQAGANILTPARCRKPPDQ
jgi:hypothetical protein